MNYKQLGGAWLGELSLHLFIGECGKKFEENGKIRKTHSTKARNSSLATIFCSGVFIRVMTRI